MTDIFKIIILIISAVILSYMLKSVNSSLSAAVTLAAGVAVIVYACTQLGTVIDFIDTLSKKAEIDSKYIGIIFKCIGICLLGEYISDICKDSGETALAGSCELVCKCSILVVAMPLYIDIFNLILKLWENV